MGLGRVAVFHTHHGGHLTDVLVRDNGERAGVCFLFFLFQARAYAPNSLVDSSVELV